MYWRTCRPAGTPLRGGPSLKKYAREGVTVHTDATVPWTSRWSWRGHRECDVIAEPASWKPQPLISATVERSLVANLPLESPYYPNPCSSLRWFQVRRKCGERPGSNSTDDFKVNGGQEGGTDVLVDGVSISLVSPNTQWNKGVSTEAVQEFKVLQSNFSPEYGESGDGS